MRKSFLYLFCAVLLFTGCTEKVTRTRIELSPSDYVLNEQEKAPRLTEPVTLSSFIYDVEAARDGSFIVAKNRNSLSIYDTESWKMTQSLKPQLPHTSIDYQDTAISSSGDAIAAIYEADDHNRLYIEVYERNSDGLFDPVFSDIIFTDNLSNDAQMISCGDIFCFRYFNNQNQSVMIPLVKENDSWTLRENRSTYSDEDDTYLLYCAQDLRQIIYCQGSDIILANFLRTVFGYPEWEKVVIGNSDGKIIASMVTADNTQLMFLSAREYGCCSLQTYDIRNKCRDSYEMVNTALLYADSAVIAPDGMSIAINSYFSTDNYITEIYRETGSEWICSFICPADANLPFFLGNDGYAVESYDHIVRFNEDTYRESQTARGLCFSHEEECSRLQVSPDGSAVVFGRGHEIAFVYLWDGEKWNRSALNDLDPFFISAADDGVLVRRNWDEDSAVYYPDGRIETIPFTPVAHTSNLSHMVTYSDDGLIIMKRNGDSWSEKCRITIGKDYKKGKFDCPGSEFFARYDGKTVYVYDWNGNIIDEIPCKAAKPSAYALSMSKDAHLIAVVQYNAENSGLHILEKGEDGWSDTFIRHGSDTDDEDKEFSVDKLNAQVCVTTSGQVVICDNSPLTFSKIDGQWKVTEIWNLAGTSLRTRQFAVSRDGDVYAGTDNRPDKARVVIGRK